MRTAQPTAESLRASDVAAAIREERLIVVLRRVAPQSRLIALVEQLAGVGVRIFEITFDAPGAADDLGACRAAMGGAGGASLLFGAGTIRTAAALDAAVASGAAFGVSPSLDPGILAATLDRGLPFFFNDTATTEIDAAWRAGSTFVKVFPASSVGPSHLREIRGPMPEVELIPTGGIDGSSAPAYLAAGAVAVGIGGAIVNASPDERAAIVAAVRPPR